MLTLEDCIGLSELTEDEIQAIAEHEHIPEMAALELGSYLVQTENGERRIRAMIMDDINCASESGNYKHAATLKLVLKHFLENHAAAARCQEPAGLR